MEKIQTIETKDLALKRIETGVLKINKEKSGYFIRGDDARTFVFTLEYMINFIKENHIRMGDRERIHFKYILKIAINICENIIEDDTLLQCLQQDLINF